MVERSKISPTNKVRDKEKINFSYEVKDDCNIIIQSAISGFLFCWLVSFKHSGYLVKPDEEPDGWKTCLDSLESFVSETLFF